MVTKQADSKQGLPVVDLPQFGLGLKQDGRENYLCATNNIFTDIVAEDPNSDLEASISYFYTF